MTPMPFVCCGYVCSVVRSVVKVSAVYSQIPPTAEQYIPYSVNILMFFYCHDMTCSRDDAKISEAHVEKRKN